MYYSNRPQTERDMLEQIQTVQPDWIYLNGALPPLTRTCLKLRRQESALQTIPVLLAPHGNLSASALAHHRIRKQSWLLYAKARGFYNDLIWHAASARESEQVRAVFGEAAQICEVPMAPKREVGRLESGNVESKEPGTKNSGTDAQKAPLLDEEGWAAQRVGVVPDSALSSPNSPLHLVYFGRLSPEKNLPFAFLLLKQFARTHPDRPVIYDLIGSGSDAYEAKLRGLAASLPATVQVNFVGQLSAAKLQARLQSPPSILRYHALLMPSLTENFSYTVLESLQAGIPVLISDQTPWRDLQSQGVGWDLSLEDPDRWLQALEDLVSLSYKIDHVSNPRSEVVRKFASAWGKAYQSKVSQLFVPANEWENVNATT